MTPPGDDDKASESSGAPPPQDGHRQNQPSPAPPETSSSAAEAKKPFLERQSVQITIALTALGIVIALLALLNDFGVFGAKDDPGTTAPIPPPAASATDTSQARPEIFDDFSTDSINTTKWQVDDPDRLFTSPEQQLRVTAPGEGRAVEGTMTALVGGDVSRVEFDATVLSNTGGSSSGGAYVILVGDDAQRRIVIGPNNVPGRNGFGIESCPTIRCDQDVDYLANRDLELGRPYEVAIRATPRAVEFTISGFAEVFRAPPLNGPVREVRIYTSSEGDDSFAVALDDVRLGRDE